MLHYIQPPMRAFLGELVFHCLWEGMKNELPKNACVAGYIRHAFNKSGRHLEFLSYDGIRGKTAAAISEF